MLFLKIAWLNMRKHWKQTVIILFAIAASEFMLVFVSAMLEGIKANFYTSLVRETGHLQVHARGWKDRLNPISLEPYMENASALVDDFAAQPGVMHAEASLMVGALVLAGDKNLGVMVVGTAPDTFFYRQARDGIRRGDFLPEGSGIAISESIARLLDVGVGDDLTLLAEDAEGSPWYISRQVSGIFVTDSLEFDERVVMVGAQTAQDLAGLDDAASEIRVDLEDPENAERLAAELTAGRGSELEILTWRQINGSLLVFIDVFDYAAIGFDLLLVLVAGTVITNAVLMTVFSRTRELGTLRAIGLRKRGVLSMVLVEGVLEGVAGSILGILIALPVVLSFREHGLSFGDLTDAFGMGNRIFFIVGFWNLVRDVAAGTLIAVFGSLYAGLVISRLSIVKTLGEA